jgi:GNAT superfamily N-acetyltransferase
MEVRRARLPDAMSIVSVHVRSWQAAYRGLLPQDFLDGLDPANREKAWGPRLANPHGYETALVIEDAGSIEGFAHVCQARDADATAGDVGEVAAIYLLPEVWGKGYGRVLMAKALSTLKDSGFSSATLWVLEGNDRARRFYEAGAWFADGAVKQDELRGFIMNEVRYRRRLSGSEN